jgi:dethiobiotin synthetase
VSKRFVITATDTDVGKTVFAAALTQALAGVYFKPVQAGLQDIDLDSVRRMTGLPAEHFLPELYRLRTPASPHRAAELDGVEIDPARLVLPETSRPMVVEGAGGLLVPLTRTTLYVDVFRRWGAPVVLCARTALGTINHSLLSLEALRTRNIPVVGIAFIGDENADSERIICEMGRVKRLGRLPRLQQLTPEHLLQAFKQHFDLRDFTDSFTSTPG